MGVTRRGVSFGLGAAMFAQNALADPRRPTGLDQLVEEGRYLPLWREAIASEGPSFNPQTAAFVGEEAVAMRGPNGSSKGEVLPLDAHAENAVEAIVAASRGRRVVILNEAHVASRHRMFLARVLRALRPEGFDIFAAETFYNGVEVGDPDVRTLAKTGVFPPSAGFYTYDPVFADTTREAVALGYRLERYEQRSDQRTTAAERAAQIVARETSEAINLARVLQDNPSSRLLVYCGYGHLRKTPTAKGDRWMASRLAESTGIDPLTVGQSQIGSFGPHGQDIPLAQAVLARFSPTEPIIVRTGENVVGAESEGADYAVFHPSLPDVEERPGWLAADASRKRLRVITPARKAGQVVIVQAVHFAEPEVAVPADQHVLARDQTAAILFLRPGTYRLRIETEEGFIPLRTVTI